MADAIPQTLPKNVKLVTTLMYIGGGLGIFFGLIGIGLFGGLIAAFCVGMIVLGIAEIVVASRVRKGDRSARMIATVLCGIGAVLALPTLPSGIFSVALNGYCVYVLQFDEEAKRFFGDA
jgi:hypothetical protein